MLSETLSGDVFWVAVDLTTGAFGSAVPPGRPARGGELPAQALIKGQRGAVTGIEAEGDHAFVVVVRPGIGAWRGTGGDGAASDIDGRANGRVQLAARVMERVRGEQAAPDELANGDLVLVFPTHRMTYMVGVVKP